MKVKELENLLESKNLEIKELLATVDAMNSVIGVDESDSEDASDHSIETVTDDDEQEMNTFVCDKCDFITKKKAGLKIHSSKVHPKIKCNNCLREFSTKEKLNRHVEVENILENICDKVNKKEDLELKEIDPDEKCIGVYSVDKPRDDAFPSIFLHSDDCWKVDDHSCSNLPNSKRFPPTDFDPFEEGILADLDHYEPTLHTTISALVVGDITEKGCYPDWERVEKILSKFTRTT